MQRMGKEIFSFYEKNKFLSNNLRIKLINATCAELVAMYGGIKVPEKAKHELGHAIITIFPNLKDPVGPTGHVGAFIVHIIYTQ